MRVERENLGSHVDFSPVFSLRYIYSKNVSRLHDGRKTIGSRTYPAHDIEAKLLKTTGALSKSPLLYTHVYSKGANPKYGHGRTPESVRENC